MPSINNQRSSVVFGILAPAMDKNDSTKIPVATVSATSAMVRLRRKLLIRFVTPNVLAQGREAGSPAKRPSGAEGWAKTTRMLNVRKRENSHSPKLVSVPRMPVKSNAMKADRAGPANRAATP